MMRHSFSFNGVDMRAAFGIVVERFSDVLTPALRPRKISIPYRDGSYDFGAQYYDERVITIDCATASLASRAAARALSLAGSMIRRTSSAWRRELCGFRYRLCASHLPMARKKR